MTQKLRVAFAMRAGLLDRIVSHEALDRLATVATFDASRVIDSFDGEEQTDLAQVDVLVTGWGCPPLTEPVLARMPRLRAVVHAAGSVKHHLSAEFWAREIAASSAADANAIPVAEFTVAAIIFSNKGVLRIAEHYRRDRASIDFDAEYAEIGNHGKRVGIVGASRIGRRVIELLRPFSFDVAVSDPYLDPEEAKALGVALLPLDELVATSDVVSLHAPSLPETHHLMNAERLTSMRRGATLINTARGALVDHEALTEVLCSGHINAVIDVTTPEVLDADSPLYDLPNVLLTPHVAGSLGTELLRMGDAAVEEVVRLAAGEPIRHRVDAASLERTA